MSTRVRIAAAVWFVTMVLAIPAAVLVFLLFLPFAGTGNAPVVVPMIQLLTPPLVAALATRLMSGYAARASTNTIFAAPIVLGFGAGLAVGAVLLSASSQPIVLVALALLPLGGAVAGSFIPWPAPPWQAGLVVGVVMLLLAWLLTGEIR